MIRKIKITVLTITLFCFCNSSFSGTAKTDAVPFVFENGNMIVTVDVHGKNYNFLFTTSGHSSVSEAIIEKFNLKVNTENQSVANTKFYSIKELKIGNTFFRNVDAKALDIEKFYNLKCKKIDGIIGADLLSDHVWKIDFNNKIISFSSDVADFGFSDQVKIVGFKTVGNNDTPIVSLKVSGVSFDDVRVNAGFNGTINLPLKDFKSHASDYKNVKYHGYKGISAKNGVTVFQETCAIIPDVSVERQSIGSTMVAFYDQGLSLIGNKLLRDYDVTFDWKNKKIYLDNYAVHDDYKIVDYGFYFQKIQDKIILIGIYEGSNAEKQGLKIGDEIIGINDVDFKKAKADELCDLYFNFKNYFNNKDINVTVLRDYKESTFTITKQTILE